MLFKRNNIANHIDEEVLNSLEGKVKLFQCRLYTSKMKYAYTLPTRVLNHT